MLVYDRYYPKAPDYKKYKAEKYEKTKQKVRMLLRGIDDTSLKDKDKAQLLKQIKVIVADF